MSWPSQQPTKLQPACPQHNLDQTFSLRQLYKHSNAPKARQWCTSLFVAPITLPFACSCSCSCSEIPLVPVIAHIVLLGWPRLKEQSRPTNIYGEKPMPNISECHRFFPSTSEGPGHLLPRYDTAPWSERDRALRFSRHCREYVKELENPRNQ